MFTFCNFADGREGEGESLYLLASSQLYGSLNYSVFTTLISNGCRSADTILRTLFIQVLLCAPFLAMTCYFTVE